MVSRLDVFNIKSNFSSKFRFGFEIEGLNQKFFKRNLNMMKIQFTWLLLLVFSVLLPAQKLSHINSGEELTYRIHYGPLNAGFATMTAQHTQINGVPHLYVEGNGRTTGMVDNLFSVQDVYQSWINLNTALPSAYVRNVKEGKFRQHLEVNFNQTDNSLLIKDLADPKKEVKKVQTPAGVQDMVSAFYFLRSLDASSLKVGSVRNLDVWIDDELFPFQLRVDGVETIDTKFGRLSCLRIIPSVKSGRVFKEKEGVTLWVSNDLNHIPVAVQAKLAVGSLRADLDNYQNVKYPMTFSK